MRNSMFCGWRKTTDAMSLFSSFPWKISMVKSWNTVFLKYGNTRGQETKEQDNSYLNLSEVYEVEKRVKEIADNWPTVWGPKNLSDIAVLSSYRYQVSDCILQEKI